MWRRSQADPELAAIEAGYQEQLASRARRGPLVRLERGRGPHVGLSESASAAEGLMMLVGVRDYGPPEGTALLAGSQALVGTNALVVAIHAPDETMAIEVARLLQPYSG